MEQFQAGDFDLKNLPASFFDNPYPFYQALRENAPCQRQADGSLFLTRYEDVRQVYFDARTFTSDKKAEFAPKFGDSPLFDHHTGSLVFNDPPLHTRVRRLIAGALTQRAISQLQGDLEALVDRLLDQLAVKARAGLHVDLVEEFACAIPVEVIGNLLAVPHDERGPLRDWSLAILGALEPQLNEEQLARGNAAVTDFCAYLRTLVARRRAAPGDPQKDVLTRLIFGEPDQLGKLEVLSEMELLQNCVFILNAGHETTTNLIANGLKLLQDWPSARRALLADASLWPNAVEEILRLESSNQLGNRGSSTEFELGGQLYPAGTRLTLCIGAANRDPSWFAQPDRFDLHREHYKHVAFGAGVHQCVGLSLARMEGRIAMSRFLARFPDYELLPGAQRAARVRFRGFTNLPARLLP
jgi:cytochrome P450